MSRWRNVRAGVLGAMLCASAACGAQDCDKLSKLALANGTITRAEAEPAGSFAPPGGKPITGLPAFCRVTGVIKPSSDSNIQFEVWMPLSGWTGKFEGVGNGGFAGSINYEQMAMAVANGYATGSTDTGHQGTPTDGTWALGHPEKIIDFGYRAIHEMTANAKAITSAYYGAGPRRAYFDGCSNGGRQALMEAQRYPEDYDGILAGAPASNWTGLLTNAVWDLQALMESDSYIPSQKLPAIEAAALKACDALDGVKDGVIENPSRCHFDASSLDCRGTETDACLTAAQVTALTKLYAGGRTATGKQVFPGYEPGGEAEPGGWAPWITGDAPGKSLMYAFGTQYFQNMVYGDAQWGIRNFNVDQGMKAAEEKTGRSLNARDADLSRFQARGGRLILFHGWSDAAIAPGGTIDYYEQVLQEMGEQRARQVVRLFMVPGMQHCTGGPGPDEFGEYSVGGTDAEHDMEAALERWVDQGVAPERIIAAKPSRDPGSKSQIVRTRPLCAYPLEAHYKGSGSTDDAANFACAPPDAKSSKSVVSPGRDSEKR